MKEDPKDSKTWVYCEHGRASQCDEPGCAGADAYDRDISEQIRAKRLATQAPSKGQDR